MKRRDIREIALQALYQLFYGKNDNLTNEKAIQSALSLEDKTEQDLPDYMQEYLNSLVSGVMENRETIDTRINANLDNWKLNRLDSIDALILRLGAYEIVYDEEMPAAVVLDEAVELAKEFSDDQSSQLVNGVLQGIVDEQGKDEEIQ